MDNKTRQHPHSQKHYGSHDNAEYRPRRAMQERHSRDQQYAEPQQNQDDKEFDYIVPRSGAYFEHDDRDVWQPRRGGRQVDKSYRNDRNERQPARFGGGSWRGRGQRYDMDRRDMGRQGFPSRRQPNRDSGDAEGGQYSPTRHAEPAAGDWNYGAMEHHGRHRERSPQNFRPQPPVDRGFQAEAGFRQPPHPLSENFREPFKQHARNRKPASPQGKWKHDLFSELDKPADDDAQPGADKGAADGCEDAK